MLASNEMSCVKKKQSKFKKTIYGNIGTDNYSNNKCLFDDTSLARVSKRVVVTLVE